MISPKPDVPKRVAAKLRAIYQKVFSARDKISYVEAHSRHILQELKEYENDPHSYAELHYPTAPDATAYPTVTRIQRLKEWLEDKAPKILRYHEELLAAEEQMVTIEESVLQELQKLRLNTPGREAWPARPATLQTLRKQWEREYFKQQKEEVKYKQQRLKNHKQNTESREIERQELIKELSEKIRINAAAMSPDRAVAYTSIMEALQERLFDDKFSLADLYDIAQGQSSVIKDVIIKAESRAIAKLNCQDI